MAPAWFLIFATISCAISAEDLRPRGKTEPRGPIFLESDTNLEITCYLLSGPNYGLRFKSDQGNISSHVTKLNDTAIRLYVPKAKPQSAVYSCYDGDDYVEVQNVNVAERPTDLKCILFRYAVFMCSFKSSNLPMRTEYTAKYSLCGSDYFKRQVLTSVEFDETEKRYYFHFDWFFSLSEGISEKCEVYLNVTPQDSIHYHLNTTVSTTKNLVVGAVDDLDVHSFSSKHIEIKYTLPAETLGLDYSWEHKVAWSCECEQRQWNDNVMFNTTLHEIAFNVTDLRYARALCNISVVLRAPQANDYYWSAPSEIKNIKVGDAPPEVYEGAFQTVKRLNATYLMVYWKEVSQGLKKDPSFAYKIKAVEGKRSQEMQVASNYALIKRLDESSDCKIEMWSKNNEGISADKSVLVVPKHTDVNLLESFTQFDRSNETILSWQTTQKFKYNITDHFNIFACDSWNHLLQQCDGQFEAAKCIRVEKSNYCKINHKNNKTLDYAVTFRTAKGWTGLHWRECCIRQNVSEKIAPKEILLNIEVQTTSALLSWKLECGDMTTPISGYIVHYCKSLGNTNNCTSPTLNYTVKGDRTTGNYKLDNLEKDAYYRTWISTMPLIKGGREQRSAISPVYVPSHGPSPLYWSIPLGIIFLITTAIFSKRLYKKYQQIKDVSVTMPSGLDVEFYNSNFATKPEATADLDEIPEKPYVRVGPKRSEAVSHNQKDVLGATETVEVVVEQVTHDPQRVSQEKEGSEFSVRPTNGKQVLSSYVSFVNFNKEQELDSNLRSLSNVKSDPKPTSYVALNNIPSVPSTNELPNIKYHENENLNSASAMGCSEKRSAVNAPTANSGYVPVDDIKALPQSEIKEQKSKSYVCLVDFQNVRKVNESRVETAEEEKGSTLSRQQGTSSNRTGFGYVSLKKFGCE